jgi:hypothetical protein
VLVRCLADSTSDFVGNMVAELFVGALERRNEQPLLRELLVPLGTEWVPHRGNRCQEKDRDAQSSRQASEATQLHRAS